MCDGVSQLGDLLAMAECTVQVPLTTFFAVDFLQVTLVITALSLARSP